MKAALGLIATSAATMAAGAAVPTVAPPLHVYAAGSATGVLGALLKQYTADTGQPVDLRTGPAGLMRGRIEAGDPVDLFVSADAGHPRTLHAAGKAEASQRFARNRLCVTALPAVGLTSANLLDRLLDSEVRIGTSTPGADPGGDYAQLFFDRVNRVRPGATAALKAKARPVVGGRIGEPALAGATNARETMEARDIEASIGSCSSRETTPDASVDKVELSAALAIRADYDMAVVSTSHDDVRIAAARRLATYLRSSKASMWNLASARACHCAPARLASRRRDRAPGSPSVPRLLA